VKRVQAQQRQRLKESKGAGTHEALSEHVTRALSEEKAAAEE
jgi:hypothetical protein